MDDHQDSSGAVSVVHVVPYYPPDRIGGVGEHVKVIHEGHLAMGIDSLIITSGSTQNDPRVHRIGSTPGRFLFNSWRLERFTRNCDVLQVHHGEGFLLALLVRFRRRRPRILTMFHVDVRRREAASLPHVFEGRQFGPKGLRLQVQRVTGLLKVLVDRLVWMLADEAVVETNSVKAELADLRPTRPITVVSHGLGPAPKGGTHHEPTDLLYVGTPRLRKRTHLLPSILNEVRKSVPDARLRIVGFGLDGDPYIRKEAERLDVLSAIEFIGPVPAEDVVHFYRAARVLVLPSAYEGLPMVLLEAMREGLVPVATDVSGHPSAIGDGVNGYLVDLDDVKAMADRCVRLLSDREQATGMGHRAMMTVSSQFDPKSELEAYLRIYRSLLAT